MDTRRAQGSFEYILMLSGVLLVVITMVYMLQGTASGADTTLEAQMKSAGVALDPSYYTPGAKPQFMPSSPADGAGSTSRPNITALITVKDATLNELDYNWNGVNYSIYDNSLVLALNFDDQAALGDSPQFVADVSGYGNNASLYANTRGLWRFDEDAGILARDESASAVNCTFDVNATWGDGKSGSGMLLNATNNSYCQLTSTVTIANVTPYTFLTWVKWNGSTTAPGTIIPFGSGSSAGNTYWSSGSNFVFYYRPYGHGSQAVSGTNTTAVFDGNWHQVAWTVNNSRVTLFVDGLQNGQPTTVINSTEMRFTYLGRGYSVNNAYYWNGTIDEVAIYNRSLGANEIQALFGEGKARHADLGLNGKWGGSMVFDGIDDQVIIPNSASLNVTGNITVAAWTKKQQMSCVTLPGPPITYPGCHDQPVVVKGDSTGTSATTPYVLTWGWGDDFYFRARAQDGTNMGVNVPSGIGNSANWHYVVGTYDGTNISIYVDGSLASANNTYSGKKVSFSSQNVYLGKLPNGQMYQGGIDEVRIWNRALSPAEIAMNYRTSLNKYTPNAWFFKYSNDSLSYGTYNYTIYTNGGYKKDGASGTRTVKYCQLPFPC